MLPESHLSKEVYENALSLALRWEVQMLGTIATNWLDHLSSPDATERSRVRLSNITHHIDEILAEQKRLKK